jgi:salicylate hydroxylase
MNQRLHVLIAGAGIGGLTAALSLLRAGCDVDVYEQAPVLREVGAGFQMSPNGTHVLHALGLGDAIRTIAWEPQGKEIRLWNTGETWPLFDLATVSVERYGFPYYMFHRADLHDLLAAAVRDLKPDAIHLGAAAAGLDQDDGGVTLELATGGAVRGDVLVGADGVHSVIRASLFGPDRPEFAGCMVWRGVIPIERLPAGLLRPMGANWVGPGGHVVHYFLRRGELVNFVGARERDDWQVESWSAAGTIEECLADFAGWHETIQTLIRNIETPFKWALMGREPMERWSVGRATLLGDACHPMLPFMAQGAVMAIEDGFILARCLGDFGDDVPAALRRYEAARLERTARTVRLSAASTALFHNPMLADPSRAAEFVAAQWDPERVKERYDWAFTYDATSVPV